MLGVLRSGSRHLMSHGAYVHRAKYSSAVPTALYKNVWRKSNVLYLTYILAGCVVLEGMYGSITSFVWDSYNSGVRSDSYFSFRIMYFLSILFPLSLMLTNRNSTNKSIGQNSSLRMMKKRKNELISHN